MSIMGLSKSLTPGTRYSRWTVIALPSGRKVSCRCDCGTERAVYCTNLRRAKSLSCGCLAAEQIATPKVFAGAKFGLWTVTGSRGRGKETIECVCDCGNKKRVWIMHLQQGRSLGCLKCRVPRTHRKSLRIGKNASRQAHSEYGIWLQMKQRCGNPRSSVYARYGARGISVCQEWTKSFESFLADMGPRPSTKHSIDRIDNNGNYEPGNVRWATFEEQGNNKRNSRWIDFMGKRQTLTQWASELGMRRTTLDYRLRNGWSVYKALTTPHTCRRERGQEAQLDRIAKGKTRVPRDGGDALAVKP